MITSDEYDSYYNDYNPDNDAVANKSTKFKDCFFCKKNLDNVTGSHMRIYTIMMTQYEIREQAALRTSKTARKTIHFHEKCFELLASSEYMFEPENNGV